MEEKLLRQILKEIQGLKEKISDIDKRVSIGQAEAKSFVAKESCEKKYAELQTKIAGIYYTGGTIISIIGLVTLLLKILGKI